MTAKGEKITIRTPYFLPWLGSKLRRQREELSLSEDALAASSGVPVSTIQRLERGELGRRDGESVKSIAGALGADLGALLTRPVPDPDQTSISTVRNRRVEVSEEVEAEIDLAVADQLAQLRALRERREAQN